MTITFWSVKCDLLVSTVEHYTTVLWKFGTFIAIIDPTFIVMKKKKVFFIVSSLSAGGAERVFWLISQGFDKSKYEVSIILFNSNNAFFSMDLEGVHVVDLKTIKASLSFPKLYKLIRKERPHAIFGTGNHINFLISFVSFFVKIPYIIARPSSISAEIHQFSNLKGKVFDKFTRLFFRNFNTIICQSDEIRNSLSRVYKINSSQMVVIPNPVVVSPVIKNGKGNNRLIIVGRLTEVKGHRRLLDIFSMLPECYSLSMAGDGELKEYLIEKAENLNIASRVQVLGQVSNVIDVISTHDVLLLTSHTEGFPNVVLESLSVGVPVVTFRVGGVSNFLIDDFNGYIVEQDDLIGFRNAIEKASKKEWKHNEIKMDIQARFSLEKVVSMYEDLIEN